MTLRRDVHGDVDAGQHLAHRTSHLRRLCRRLESGGIGPIDVAGHGERNPCQPEATGRIGSKADVGLDIERAGRAAAWPTSLDNDIA